MRPQDQDAQPQKRVGVYSLGVPNAELGGVASMVQKETAARLAKLTPDRLDDLGEALLDFSSIAELEKWLAQSLGA